MRNRKKTKKGFWAHLGILSGIFLLALVVSSLLTNRGTDDQTISLGDPTLPRVSFSVADQTVNILEGYVNEMDITAMRDTITPVPDNGILTLGLEKEGNEIESVQYEVYSLDGATTYLQDTVRDLTGSSVTLDVNKGLPEGIQESVLKIILETEEKEQIFYYTRIEWQSGLSIAECLNFAEQFHESTFGTETGLSLGEYLEPGEKSDNTTLQTVNIHSALSQVQWGDLEPQISTGVEWSIKESNSVYTSLLADYQVTCKGDTGEVETFNIKEFFRVRYSGGEMFLLDYNRSMNQVFNGNKQVLDENGILLGMAEPDVGFTVNRKGTVVSFVQERDLWTYNQKTDELSLVFSFANTEGHDVRSRNDEHAVRIISMEADGSTVFAVYGYMNRGEHEGEVGVDVYYFDIKKNAVNEIAFIPSTKSFVIAEDELGKMVYYNHQEQLLYVLAGGILYQVDVTKNTQKELATGLTEGQYVASSDGHLLAYQTDGELNTAQTVRVMNLANGSTYEVEARKGEAIRPLGFIKNDFICGYVRESDLGKTTAGEEMLPMYELEIRDSDNQSEMNYTQEGIYISDIIAEENMVTLNRVTKDGDVYTGTSQDYITSNEERKESAVTLESYDTERKQRQMRLTFTKEIKELSPHILRPKQVMIDQAVTISLNDKIPADRYYVYGVGELVAIYDKAAYAIQKAEQISGVVISSEQAYVWEKGNRDLVYYNEILPFGLMEGQNSFDTCISYAKQYGSKKVDLSGCTLSQVLYIINKGTPVLAMTDSSHTILLTGYSMDTVTYIDPDTAAEYTVTMEEMEAMTAGSGNTFVVYMK